MTYFYHQSHTFPRSSTIPEMTYNM